MTRTMHHIGQTPSTQEIARQLLKNGQAQVGDTVVADRQTDGRGRYGRTWISPAGGLYLTAILAYDALISLRCGLAVVRALESNGISAGLKWPNDVLVNDRKIAGVLVETDGTICFAGIGLNLTSAPLATATCVAAHTGTTDRNCWSHAIADSLAAITSQAFDWDHYRRTCLTLGRQVRIERLAPKEPIEGRAVDIDDVGRLIVRTMFGTQAISSGECLHLREPMSNS